MEQKKKVCEVTNACSVSALTLDKLWTGHGSFLGRVVCPPIGRGSRVLLSGLLSDDAHDFWWVCRGPFTATEVFEPPLHPGDELDNKPPFASP